MKLSQFKLKEKVYIDSNIFLEVFREGKYWKECKEFLKKIEEGKLRGVISPLVVDEVSFNIMIDELTTKLNEKTHLNILKKIKRKTI